MNETIIGIFAFGFVVGILSVSLYTLAIWEHTASQCAEKHNVYKCTYVYVPVE